VKPNMQWAPLGLVVRSCK